MRTPLLAALFAGLTLFGVAGSWLRGQVVLSNDSVLLLTEDFTGELGTGAGEVSWAGSGGFAAVGGDRTVQIGGSPTEINWDAPNFIGLGRTLILGDPNADGTLIWDKAINLGNANRRIRVLHGSGNTGRADARLDKALRGETLSIEGDGRLDITGNNPQLRRTVFIYGAELRLNASGRLGALRFIQVYRGGAFTLDNAGTSNAATGGLYLADRLADSLLNVRLDAGTFRYIGQHGAGNSIESFLGIDFSSGSNTIDIVNHRTDFFSEVRVKRLRVMSLSATVNFISSSGVSDFGDGARFRIEDSLTLTNDILPYATVNGADWASVNSENGIISYGGYNTDAQTNWNSASINGSPTASQVLNSNRSLNSLRLTGGIYVDLAGRTLALNAGALLSTGAIDNTINGGVLSLASNAYMHGYNTGGSGLTISSVIRGTRLTKTGPGSLTFSGTAANALNSGVYVNEGLLILNKSSGVAAISSQVGWRLTIGDGGHSASVRLNRGEQIANGADVWLQGGFADPARHVWHEAVLQFNGAGEEGITETFRTLDVQGIGVIDFQGGTLGAPNFLILDDLNVRYGQEGGSVLLVRNWVDFEDRLLVKRTSANLAASLPHIHFEGYAPGAETRDYNVDFWEVVPAPELSSYGALLGTLGLALWLRRRKSAIFSGKSQKANARNEAPPKWEESCPELRR